LVRDKLDSLLAIYKDNFCDCPEGICKNGLGEHFKSLMKQDLNMENDTFNNMMNLMMGSPSSKNQVNVLMRLLEKINIGDFPSKKMDEILNLFVVVYLKCSQAVQLTFVDDIDKVLMFIREDIQKVIIDKKFTYQAVFYSIY